jgi:hypothetical protein
MGSKFRVTVLRLRVWDLGFQGQGFGVKGLGCKV